MQQRLESIILYYDIGPVALAAASPRTRTQLELPRPSERGLVTGGVRGGVVSRLHRSPCGWHDVDTRSIELCGETVPTALLMARTWWEQLHGLRRRLPLRVVAHRLREPLSLSVAVFGAPVRALDVSGCPARGVNALRIYGDDAGNALETLYMNRCEGVTHLDFLRDAPGLRCVHARECLVEDVSALASCPALSEVHLDRCFQLHTVAPLSGCPRLRELVLSYAAGLRDVDGLARCAELETLDVQRAYGLTDLSGLAGAPRLARVDASFSGVRGLDGLDTCVCLVEINLTGCLDLTSLAALAGAPQLRVLRAAETGIKTLPASLAQCAQLEEVYVDRCSRLTDMDGLRTAPRLTRLHASQADVLCVAASSSLSPPGHAARAGDWPALTVLDLSGNRRLVHVCGLRAAPCLTTLTLSGSGLTTVEGLGRCARLDTLDVARCARLETLDGLVGDAREERVEASVDGAEEGAVRHVVMAPLRCLALSGCTALVALSYAPTLAWSTLEVIDVSHCPVLTHVDGLAHAPRLQRFLANFSGLESIAGLAPCTALAEVQLEGCAFLRSIEPLRHAPALRTVLAKDAGIHHLAPSPCLFTACVALTLVDLDGCEGLKDAAALAPCPALEEARLCWTAVRDLSWAAGCPQLVRLFVVGCWRLHDLGALATTSTPSGGRLQQVWASQSGVRTVAGLERCTSLSLVDLRGCEDLAWDNAERLQAAAPWIDVRLGDV